MLDIFKKSRVGLSLSHCIEGLIVQIPVTFIFGVTVGPIAVIVWYWSRKKLEIEIIAGHDNDPVSTWRVGWFPWTWDKYRQLDLYFPAISSIAIAIIFNWK